ncbi:hypothetical protein GGTG_01625 [Gaeumannomyces tritici R3-111a-1]|uniref:Uncharacterized protein n=1 Tax=Gaeumannomyces tritici (strain R3-111a-1) TaxID=644352 RepID=J3NK43_GAET3|nr:hypothetical protein GGTG_01625 [Gaeumannomyces tritici R3-111a-1]EJT81647.1 hypothetical protein GGTG_01625 [Gaeumannomyces tritici R3-111a-1]
MGAWQAPPLTVSQSAGALAQELAAALPALLLYLCATPRRSWIRGLGPRTSPERRSNKTKERVRRSESWAPPPGKRPSAVQATAGIKSALTHVITMR